MSLLAVRVGAGVLALLALIALRGKRWAYLAFVVLGLLYFPAQTHFHVHVPKCEQLLPTMHVLVLSLHNYAYIALFAGFYWMSWVQFERSDARGIWALLATLLVGALVEIAEGMTMTGRGHCRVRDLVPDAAGALGAAVLLAVWSRLTRKPGYVRLVRPHAAAAPRPAAPTARAVVPPRGVVPPPPSRGLPGLYVPPPSPPDFSPGPTPVTPAADMAPTHEVAPRGGAAIAARRAVVQHLQTILRRLREILQRLWMTIRGRRRAIVVGVVLLALVGAGAFVILRLRAVAPVVTAQPNAVPPPPLQPPPPPPRPLQSEAEGYYELSYKFTVSDRRFTRLTLRPEPFVTFARTGTRDEVGCADARISPAAVHLRCEFERVGIMVTIEGQFPSRSVTSRLDAPVLDAMVTVTNTRGETLFRARESFYWHEPD